LRAHAIERAGAGCGGSRDGVNVDTLKAAGQSGGGGGAPQVLAATRPASRSRRRLAMPQPVVEVAALARREPAAGAPSAFEFVARDRDPGHRERGEHKVGHRRARFFTVSRQTIRSSTPSGRTSGDPYRSAGQVASQGASHAVAIAHAQLIPAAASRPPVVWEPAPAPTPLSQQQGEEGREGSGLAEKEVAGGREALMARSGEGEMKERRSR